MVQDSEQLSELCFSLLHSLFIFLFQGELVTPCRREGNVFHCYVELDTTQFMPEEARSFCPSDTYLTKITSQEELEFLLSLKCK